MARNAALTWLNGRGWLVLAGATPAADAVRAHALSIAAADGAVAYVATQGANADTDQLLADMADLGARSGYVVDMLTEDDAVIRDQLGEAGIIVIGADSSVNNVRSSLLGAGIEGVRTAFENGAVILAEGPAAMAFGAWTLDENKQVVAGLNWLVNGFVLPGINRAAEAPAARQILAAQPSALAVGIGLESALALGPDGEVEIWGEQQVAIALGPNFGA